MNDELPDTFEFRWPPDEELDENVRRHMLEIGPQLGSGATLNGVDYRVTGCRMDPKCWILLLSRGKGFKYP